MNGESANAARVAKARSCLIAAGILLAAVVLGIVAIDRFVLRPFRRRVVARDSCFRICTEVHHALKKRPHMTQSEFEQVISGLRTGEPAVLFDKDGRPVDPWGNPFHVTHQQVADGFAVTCVSAGPDRVRGTRDDISCVWPEDSQGAGSLPGADHK